MNFSPCAVVPVFNHHASLPAIVAALCANHLPVILVDDGSNAETKQVLAKLADQHPDIECLTLARNSGKGAAVLAGFTRAGLRGFSHALQIDADGQHDSGDIPALLALARRNPGYLISGTPRYDHTVPAVRFYSRYLTHSLVWLDTLSFSLRDSMCGLRIYPLTPVLQLMARTRIGARMDFDTDIMVRLYWAGTESLFLPTRVRYPEDGVSHFRMLRDNLRMIWLHLRLFAGLWPRVPQLLQRNRSHRRARHWARVTERGNLGGLRFIAWLDRHLGRRFTQTVLYPVTGYFFLSQARARRASREFLSAVGLHATPALLFRHFMSFSVTVLDKAAVWHDPESLHVEIPERAALVSALSSGRGALLLSAHLGNLDVARALASHLPDMRINALVYTQNSRKVNALLAQTSTAYGLRLIQVQDIGADTALLLRQKITAGETVVIVGDRTPVSTTSPVVAVPFLGRPARFAVGPYVLAHVLECPVYLLFCLREAQAYRIHFEPFAERIRLPRAGRGAATAEWAGRYARRLEDYARRFPLQWYNFYDFWDAPAAGSFPDELRVYPDAQPGQPSA